MYENLSEAVHNVLRTWHSGKLEELPWTEWLIVRQHLVDQPLPNLEVAVKQVVLEALDLLTQLEDGEAARILRLRFLDDLTSAAAAANCLNLTENIIYKKQRAAIEELAALIQQAEHQAKAARAARVLARLEIPDPPHLFGVAGKLAKLQAILTSPDSPSLIAVSGIGGIGKTSLDIFI